MFVMHWQGNGIARLTYASEQLSSNKKNTALRRALNHTGAKTFTIVKRTLQQQIGAPQHIILRYGRIRPVRASGGLLEYQIVSRGGPIPLKHFGAYQTRRGVSAAPWRNRKLYKSAFIVASLGGHVFWREGKPRLPIQRVAGPNVPKEMVKDATAAAFQATVATSLPARVAHEIRVLTAGVVS
jgi:hypothetical protein